MAIVATTGFSAVARAQARPLAPPIEDNNYTLQYFQGPLLMPSDVIAVGGAYAAIAEGPAGAYVNAAAPAVRSLYSTKLFDYDIGFSFSLPGSFHGVDFENRGTQGTARPASSRFQDTFTVNAGVLLQYGPFGVSFNADNMTSGLRSEGGKSVSEVVMRFNRFIGLFGWSLADQQLQLGFGFRAANLDFVRRDEAFTDATTLFAPTGLGPQFGFIARPNNLPFRIGGTYRAPVYVTRIEGASAESLSSGVEAAAGKILPSRIALPWEVEIGAAIQLGPRPLNPEPVDVAAQERAVQAPYERARILRGLSYERELDGLPQDRREARRARLERRELEIRDQEDEAIGRELSRLKKMRDARIANLPREYILVLLTGLATGGTSNSIGLESFIDQRYERFGQNVSLSPRFGVEGEPIPEWLRLRAGGYVEPSRYETGVPRQHFTFGADVRLFTFDPLGIMGGRPWLLRLAVDLAPRYFNYGLSIGGWR